MWNISLVLSQVLGICFSSFSNFVLLSLCLILSLSACFLASRVSILLVLVVGLVFFAFHFYQKVKYLMAFLKNKGEWHHMTIINPHFLHDSLYQQSPANTQPSHKSGAWAFSYFLKSGLGLWISKPHSEFELVRKILWVFTSGITGFEALQVVYNRLFCCLLQDVQVRELCIILCQTITTERQECCCCNP